MYIYIYMYIRLYKYVIFDILRKKKTEDSKDEVGMTLGIEAKRLGYDRSRCREVSPVRDTSYPHSRSHRCTGAPNVGTAPVKDTNSTATHTHMHDICIYIYILLIINSTYNDRRRTRLDKLKHMNLKTIGPFGIVTPIPADIASFGPSIPISELRKIQEVEQAFKSTADHLDRRPKSSRITLCRRKRSNGAFCRGSGVTEYL